MDLRGDGVDVIIARVESAVASYPHSSAYRMWPGPNSNTFTAWIGRSVPELGLTLPPTAIGKDYRCSVGTTTSGGGLYQPPAE